MKKLGTETCPRCGNLGRKHEKKLEIDHIEIYSTLVFRSQ